MGRRLAHVKVPELMPLIHTLFSLHSLWPIFRSCAAKLCHNMAMFSMFYWKQRNFKFASLSYYRVFQEAYYCLMLLEKVAKTTPGELRTAGKPKSQLASKKAELAGQKAELALQIWMAAKALLLHRHLWVQKVAGRLLGLAFADATTGNYILLSPGLWFCHG